MIDLTEEEITGPTLAEDSAASRRAPEDLDELPPPLVVIYYPQDQVPAEPGKPLRYVPADVGPRWACP
jgi:hypothetical protein